MSSLGLRGISFTTLFMSGFTLSPRPSPLLRQQYLASLEESQEWFLEELVGLGQFWTQNDGSYGVTHGKTLVEFFSVSPASSEKLLLDFQDQNGFSTALVKSFDRDLVRSCEQLEWTFSVEGYLFRKRGSRGHVAFDSAKMSQTIQDEVRSIWNINDDFFDNEDEIAKLVEADRLLTVTVDGEIAGCGLFNRVIEENDAVDVGMMVAPSFRRRGLGAYIVNKIADRIESEGLRPICGCGASNIASKATLEKAGFVTEHQLLAFTP